MPQATSRDGTRIGYETAGQGPALIVVTGATQFRAVDHASPRLAAALGGRVAVTLFDRRGRGESGDAPPYAVAREVEDVGALIDAAGGRAALMGHSSGAVLAVEAAAAMPDRVAALLLYEPPLDPAQPPAAAWAECEAMEAMARTGDRAAMLERFLDGIGLPPEVVAGLRAGPAWPALVSAAPTIAHDLRLVAEAADGGRLPARWRRAAMPAVVVSGDASFGFMAAAADRVAAALPDARRVTLPGQGHEYDPAALAPILLDLLHA